MNHALITAGLSVLGKTGLASLVSPWTRGLGAILMFHHVRPVEDRGFNPFGGLEITPEFLDALLDHLRRKGYEILPISELADRLRNPRPGKPFVVLTFDDGYRDNVEYALPVLRRHAAPFTVFATTGFADGTAPLWWLDMADAAACGNAQTDAERRAAFEALHAKYVQLPGEQQAAFVAALLRERGVDNSRRTCDLCLDWQALAELANDPLCTIGAHTLTHPLLAKLPAEMARNEIVQSKQILEERLGRKVLHLAYPVGNADVAGAREFRLAGEAGFQTAVTTRSGVVFPEHTNHLMALPRLSVNGLHQDLASFDTLLTGLPFFLMNRGKTLSIG